MSPAGNIVIEQSPTMTSDGAEGQFGRAFRPLHQSSGRALVVGSPDAMLVDDSGTKQSPTSVERYLRKLARPIPLSQIARSKPLLIAWSDLSASTADVLVPVVSPEEAIDSTTEFWHPVLTGTDRHLSWAEAFSRLDEFGRLSANWDSYGADPISPIALARAREILFALRDEFAERFDERFVPVNIAPIADGGVQLEWERDGFYIEVELITSGDIACFVAEGRGPDRRTYSEEGISATKVTRLVAAFLNISVSCRINW